MPSVKMKTTSAGPAGTRLAGKVYPVDADEGAALVAGGFATWVDAPEVRDVVVETTTLPPTENAARTPKRRKP